MNQNMKSLSIAALVMVGMLACVKETPQETTPEEAPGVKVTLSTTVSLAEDTKALTPTGVKTFAEGEQIAVVYNNGSTTVKAVSEPLAPADITNEGRSAQFTVTLTDPDRSQNVTYIYPAAMAKDNGEPNWEALASQNGTLATLASQLDYAKYTGAWTAGALPTGTLDNQLAILALTLKSSDGASVITNEIGRLTIFTGAHSYVVTRTPAEGPIYVAIHPTSGADIQLVAQSATRFYTKSLTGKTYAASNGYNASFRMAALPEGALPGKFAIANGTEVYFSRGNLQAVFASAGSSCTWQFAANQWDYIGGINTANDKINGNGSVSAAGTVDLFGWSTNATYYGIHNSKEDVTYNGSFKDWGTNAITNGGNKANIWYTPSQDEWTYLTSTRSTTTTNMPTGTNSGTARYTKATVASEAGLILFPDNYAHPNDASVTVSSAAYNNNNSGFGTFTVNAENWAKMEAAGAVFLPTAGWRRGSDEGGGTDDRGRYWLATVKDSESAYSIFFGTASKDAANDYYRRFGRSVRLVKGTAPVTGISLNRTTFAIPVGNTETLTATVTPSTAANPGVSWTSNNSAVATVNASTGQITAVAKGTATITATALDGSGITATCTVTVIQEGALTGQFSVSGTKKVYFSKGNLQYIGSAATPYWKFADNQWDYLGTSTGQNSSATNVDRDLFGWGTKTDPNKTSNESTSYSWNEWGENAITNGGNRINSGWRTLESTEWAYLWNSRDNAANLRTLATVNNVTGLILMPDGWTASGVALTVTTANYTTNNINSTDWNTLEQQGCVFLPAGGYRHGTGIIYAGSYGAYWSSTSTSSDKATSMDFSSSTVEAYDTNRSTGCSVRLVCNAN